MLILKPQRFICFCFFPQKVRREKCRIRVLPSWYYNLSCVFMSQVQPQPCLCWLHSDTKSKFAFITLFFKSPFSSFSSCVCALTDMGFTAVWWLISSLASVAGSSFVPSPTCSTRSYTKQMTAVHHFLCDPIHLFWHGAALLSNSCTWLMWLNPESFNRTAISLNA